MRLKGFFIYIVFCCFVFNVISVEWLWASANGGTRAVDKSKKKVRREGREGNDNNSNEKKEADQYIQHKNADFEKQMNVLKANRVGVLKQIRECRSKLSKTLKSLKDKCLCGTQSTVIRTINGKKERSSEFRTDWSSITEKTTCWLRRPKNSSEGCSLRNTYLKQKNMCKALRTQYTLIGRRMHELKGLENEKFDPLSGKTYRTATKKYRDDPCKVAATISEGKYGCSEVEDYKTATKAFTITTNLAGQKIQQVMGSLAVSKAQSGTASVAKATADTLELGGNIEIGKAAGQMASAATGFGLWLEEWGDKNAFKKLANKAQVRVNNKGNVINDQKGLGKNIINQFQIQKKAFNDVGSSQTELEAAAKAAAKAAAQAAKKPDAAKAAAQAAAKAAEAAAAKAAAAEAAKKSAVLTTHYRAVADKAVAEKARAAAEAGKTALKSLLMAGVSAGMAAAQKLAADKYRKAAKDLEAKNTPTLFDLQGGKLGEKEKGAAPRGGMRLRPSQSSARALGPKEEDSAQNEDLNLGPGAPLGPADNPLENMGPKAGDFKEGAAPGGSGGGGGGLGLDTSTQAATAGEGEGPQGPELAGVEETQLAYDSGGNSGGGYSGGGGSGRASAGLGFDPKSLLAQFLPKNGDKNKKNNSSILFRGKSSLRASPLVHGKTLFEAVSGRYKIKARQGMLSFP